MTALVAGRDQGPFIIDPPGLPEARLGVFLAIGVVTALTLAAAAARQRHTEAALRRTQERHPQSEHFTELLESAPDAMVIANPAGTIHFVNAQIERLLGYRRDELVGRPIDVLVPERLRPLRPDRPATLLAPADRPDGAAELLASLGRGERIEHLESVRLTRAGRRIDVDLTLWPIRGPDGTVTGTAAIARDITQRKRAEAKQRLIRGIADELASSLNPNQIARRLADSLVPALVDHAAIDLIEPDDHNGGICFHRVALRRHEKVRPLLAPLGQVDTVQRYGPKEPAAQAYQRGQPVLYPTLTPEDIAGFDLDETARELVIRAELRAAAGVPMRARGRVVGILSLAQSASGRALTQEDMTWAVNLADRAGMAFDNGQLYEQQRHTALTLQRSLMGTPAPLPRIDTAARYRPAASGAGVGGDWFDLIPLPRGKSGLLIGDVMGRGLEAAAVMGQLRSAAHALALTGMLPSQLMRNLNTMVTTMADQMVTCCYLVVHPTSHEVCICTAGHPPPVVCPTTGPASVLQIEVGLPLGVGQLPYRDISLSVAPGSTLALYTDGLVESPHTDLEARIDALAATLEAIPAETRETKLETVADHILTTMPDDGDHDDDVTLLLARLPMSTATTLRSNPDAVPTGRAFLSDALHEWAIAPETVETARLLTSELLTNAIRYGLDQPVSLRLHRTHTDLTVEVTDHNPAPPALREAAEDEEGGRGLLLVNTLAPRWGTTPHHPGKTVWFSIPTGPQHP